MAFQTHATPNILPPPSFPPPPPQISKEMSLPLLCRGRQYKVEGCSCEDVEGLRGAMESLAEMVLAYKNKGRAKMGWVD